MGKSGIVFILIMIMGILVSCSTAPAGLWTGEKGVESYSLSLARDGRYLISGVNPEGQLFEDRGLWSISNRLLMAVSDKGRGRIWDIVTMNGKQLVLKNEYVPEGKAGELLALHPAALHDMLGIWYSPDNLNLVLTKEGYGIYGVNPQGKSFVDLGLWEYSDGLLIARSHDGNVRTWDVILLGADKLVLKSREVKETGNGVETIFNRVDPSEFYGNWKQGNGRISFLNDKNYTAAGIEGAGSAGSYQYNVKTLTLHPADGEAVIYDIQTYSYSRITMKKAGNDTNADIIVWERASGK